MRKLWSKTCEREQGNEKERSEGSLYPNSTLSEEDGSEGLSRPKQRRQSHDCTSRL